MSNNKEVLLKVENLCQYFKVAKREFRAVDDVSFEIYKGEVFGVVGESCCGKTTTGRSIIRLYDITSGNVYFKGLRIAAGTKAQKDKITLIKKEANETVSNLKKELKANPEKAEAIQNEINSVSEKAKAEVSALNEDIKQAQKDHKNAPRDLVTQIQMIFQDPISSLNPRMTVREIITEGLIIGGCKDKEEIQQKLYDILEVVGLVREHADRYPHEFSGGQRQRIGIARAMIINPELIVADEPISALDVSIQAQVINLMNDLREKLGLTIMFIAHDLSVVKYFSDRIAVMYFGKMVELATAKDLFENPTHPYTKSLLTAIPLADPHYEKKRVRIPYNPLVTHDYSVNKPSLREIKTGHFVYCNDEEEIKYKKELK